MPRASSFRQGNQHCRVRRHYSIQTQGHDHVNSAHLFKQKHVLHGLKYNTKKSLWSHSWRRLWKKIYKKKTRASKHLFFKVRLSSCGISRVVTSFPWRPIRSNLHVCDLDRNLPTVELESTLPCNPTKNPITTKFNTVITAVNIVFTKSFVNHNRHNHYS